MLLPGFGKPLPNFCRNFASSLQLLPQKTLSFSHRYRDEARSAGRDRKESSQRHAGEPRHIDPVAGGESVVTSDISMRNSLARRNCGRAWMCPMLFARTTE